MQQLNMPSFCSEENVRCLLNTVHHPTEDQPHETGTFAGALEQFSSMPFLAHDITLSVYHILVVLTTVCHLNVESWPLSSVLASAVN